MRQSHPTRIVVDVRKIADSGIGVYLRNTVPRVAALMPETHFVLLGESAKLAPYFSDLANCEIAECPVPSLSIKEQVQLPRYLPKDGSLYWATHFNIPLTYVGPLVVTVHDIMPLGAPGLSGGKIHELYTRVVTTAMRLRRADIISVSQFTADELKRLAHIDPARITVISEGVDASWSHIVPRQSPREKPYLLYVGLVKPHKNLLGLLKAFERIAPNWPHDLVIVGDLEKIKTRDEEAGKYAERFGERVVFTGWVTDDQLEQYLAHAEALVFPSFYEGFGLPALEAMACGCPVIASSASSLPEVCGEAALHFDPRNPDEIASVVARFLGDSNLRAEMRRLGLDNASRFTWERTAEATAARLTALLAGS